MRKGYANVISARSAARSWKFMLFAPPPASAWSNTRASTGRMGLRSVPAGPEQVARWVSRAWHEEMRQGRPGAETHAKPPRVHGDRGAVPALHPHLWE